MPNKERIVYADLLRIVATGAVIVLHTAASRWYGTPVKSLGWQAMNAYDSLVRWAVPVFVMVSGMFQLKPNSPEQIPLTCADEYRVMFRKYLLRFICALAFWSIVHNGFRQFTRFFIRHEEIEALDIANIFLKIPFGPAWYHMWFVYMILGLYLITPLVRIFINHALKPHLHCFLILFAAVGTGIPLVTFIFRKIPDIPGYRLYLPLSELTGYLGYYIAGYYFATYKLQTHTRKLLYTLAIVSVVITAVGTSFFSMIGERREEALYEYIFPTTMLTSFGIFVFFKERFGALRLSPKAASVVSAISGCTFGIYLLHDLVLQIFLLVGLSATTFNAIFSIPLIALAVFAISLPLIYGLRKVPVLGRYVV
jgi:surface polysaccharide O-acyltransferase-like enzyme